MAVMRRGWILILSEGKAKRISHGGTAGGLAGVTGKLELPSSAMGKTTGGTGETKESGAIAQGTKRSRKNMCHVFISCILGASGF